MSLEITGMQEYGGRTMIVIVEIIRYLISKYLKNYWNTGSVTRKKVWVEFLGYTKFFVWNDYLMNFQPGVSLGNNMSTPHFESVTHCNLPINMIPAPTRKRIL